MLLCITVNKSWRCTYIIVFIHRIVPHVGALMGKMVARIHEQEETIRRVLSMDRKNASLNLTWQDKDVLQSMHQV